MAAPTLQAEGATATGVTTGAPTVTIPTHQANDILVVQAMAWVPNTTTPDAAQIPTPAGGWAAMGSQVGQPAASPRDGWVGTFWLRASGAGTTVTLTRGAGWDTGTDTCFNARAYVIRGCRTSGNPFESTNTSGPHTGANQAFPAVTVSGADRLVVIFGAASDNLGFSLASSGWTTGTEDNDAGGTDSSFQTARKDAQSSSTSADTATAAAPTGFYAFIGASFVPAPVTHDTSGAPAGAGAAVVGSASSATTRPSSGALTGQSATVAGSAARTRAHAATGVVAGSGAEVVGSADRQDAPSGVTHDTSGALEGQAAALAGSASSATVRTSSGALVGQGAAVSGAASSATARPASGALVGQASAIAGAAARTRAYATSGVVASAGAAVAGSASIIRLHGTTGVLAAGGALVAGAAERQSAGPAAHASSGALSGAGAGVAGVSARSHLHATTGALKASGAEIESVAARWRHHDAAGGLIAAGSVIAGAADRVGQGAVTHSAAGALEGDGAVLVAYARNLLPHDVSPSARTEGDGGGVSVRTTGTAGSRSGGAPGGRPIQTSTGRRKP